MESKGSSKTDVLGAIRKTFQGLSPATFPNIVALADVLIDADIEARFLFGLDCLIAGIAQRLAQKQGARVSSSRSAKGRALRHAG
jgi:hypothetical protein